MVWVVARVSNSDKMILGAGVQGWEEQQETWGSVLVHVGIIREFNNIQCTRMEKGGGRDRREGRGHRTAAPGVVVVMEMMVDATYTCDTIV